MGRPKRARLTLKGREAERLAARPKDFLLPGRGQNEERGNEKNPRSSPCRGLFVVCRRLYRPPASRKSRKSGPRSTGQPAKGVISRPWAGVR
jgi:hypothetical protein